MRREKIVEIDKRHVWHPYTEMSQYRTETNPLVIVRAQGSRLYDADGRSYLDGNASWWTAVLGHQHPRLVAALKRQADQLCHTSLAGATHELAARLAQRLVEVAPPGLEHVLYGDDGSTAVEAAIKMALKYWQQNGRPDRTSLIALDGAFHGETLGVTALGGVEVFRRPYAHALMDCIHVPSAADGHAQAFEVLEKMLRERQDKVAGVVLEPLVQGASGMRIYGAEYLRRARELCSEVDTFLILDEVFTGYGRTGPMWASQHAGIEPDILCTAKGFSGGLLPMAATLSNARIFDGFLGAPERAFFYGHTFCGNPLGAAVALEVLEVFADEGVLEKVPAKAQRIAKCFEELGQLPEVAQARSLGMVGALELKGTGYLDKAGWRVYVEALRRGAYVRPLGNVVYVTPPINIADGDLQELLAIVGHSVQSVCA